MKTNSISYILLLASFVLLGQAFLNATPSKSAKLYHFKNNKTATFSEVTAQFEASDYYILIGDTVNFDNNSQSADTYQWAVNNILISNDINTEYTFLNVGIYSVCLVAENDLCQDTLCRDITVLDEFPDCVDSYINYLGIAGLNVKGEALIATNDGFIMGGSVDDNAFLRKMDQNMNPVWEELIEFTSESNRILHLKMDGDTHLVGIGLFTIFFTALSREYFFFRFDLNNHTFEWVKKIPVADASLFQSILIPPNANDYIFSGQAALPFNENGCDGVFLALDKNTGDISWKRRYTLSKCETFLHSEIYNNKIYVAGQYDHASSGPSKVRSALSCFDLEGNELWSKTYFLGVQSADLSSTFANDLHIENNAIYMFSHGDLGGTSDFENTFQFSKKDLNGNIEWVKTYDIEGALQERSRKILSVPDGFLLCGQYVISPDNSTANNNIFIIKIDKQGVVQWGKTYGTTENETVDSDFFIQNDFIYILGSRTYFNIDDVAWLGILNLDGTTDEDCSIVEDINIETTNLTTPITNNIQLSEMPYTIELFDLSPSTEPIVLNEGLLCSIPCEELCTDLSMEILNSVCIDIDLALSEYVYSTVSYQICNIGEVATSFEIPFQQYYGDPLTEDIDALVTISSNSIAPLEINECTTITQQFLNRSLLNGFSMVINDNGNTPPPYDLAIDYPNTNLIECNYLNNIAVLDITFISTPAPDLGTDVEICANEEVTFDAGNAYVTYQWQDGSTESTFTTDQTGIYWVDVSNECGDVYRDSIEVFTNSYDILNIGENIEACPSTEITLQAMGFDTYQWFQATTMICDNCSELTVAPDTSTTFIVVGNTDLGCVGIDSITIEIITETSFVSTDTSICFGDSIWFGTQFESVEGLYTFTTNNMNACDTTYQLNLTIDDPITVDFTIIKDCINSNSGAIETTVTGGAAPYNYIWADNPIAADNRINLSSGVYDLTVIDNRACSLSSQAILETIEAVELIPVFEPSICENNNLTLSLLNTSDHITYQWTGPMNFDRYEETTIIEDVALENAGTYSVSANNEDCEVGSESFDIDVLQQPETPIINGDTVLCEQENEVIQLSTNVENSDFLWSTGANSPSINISRADDYRITVSNECGTASASIEVEDFCGCWVTFPNAFSPNFDGINDTFDLFTNCPFSDYQLSIFDRWGTLVFQSNDPTQKWDGRYQNKPLHQGVYVYVLDFTTETNAETLSGDVTLMR